jgi:hypothetical protein
MWHEIMEKSSIHGCNHTIAKNRHFFEKFVALPNQSLVEFYN